MNTSSLNDFLITSGNKADIIVQIGRGEVKNLIAQELTCVFAEGFQAELLTQMGKTLVKMLQLDNKAVANEIRTASVPFLEAFIANLFSWEAVEYLMSKCLDR